MLCFKFYELKVCPNGTERVTAILAHIDVPLGRTLI